MTPPHTKPRRVPLDNAGKLYPAVATAEWNAVFRVSALMKEVVEPDILQAAADRVLPRFPLLKVRLHPGFFWYTLEDNTAPFFVREDAGVFCLRFRWHEDNAYLLQIFCFGPHVSVEFFHALTDGYGAMVFLKTLMAEYALSTGIMIAIFSFIPYFGAFISAFLGGFMILVSQGLAQALYFILFIVVLQQIDGALIYPRIVGKSIRLPGMWVLTAATIGGKVAGVVGVLISIPFCSLCYTLMREAVEKREAMMGESHLDSGDGIQEHT